MIELRFVAERDVTSAAGAVNVLAVLLEKDGEPTFRELFTYMPPPEPPVEGASSELLAMNRLVNRLVAVLKEE